MPVHISGGDHGIGIAMALALRHTHVHDHGRAMGMDHGMSPGFLLISFVFSVCYCCAAT